MNRRWVASGPRHQGGLAERAAPGRDVAANGLEAALLEAHRLVESGLSTHRGTLMPGSAQWPPSSDAGPAHTDHGVVRWVALAQWSVGMVLPDDAERIRAVSAAVENLGEKRRRGLVVRLLCTSDAPDGDMVRALAGSGMTSSTRVTANGVPEAVIVDGRVAYLPGDGAGLGRTTLRSPAAVRVLESLFAGAWDTAVPLADHDRLRHHTRSETARGVLNHLGAGLTDDAGAREMRVSLRTYRRHVADLMRALEAGTRFEAGARAVELGLVPCHG
ncbi:response regulator transcription factor [Streptomyces sp. JHA26]|uniref:helix-turn-helix transcriptional regulator n=1 Tax=Streptomyces sp. JHA26 TaxID=1917143 RepID=UPI00117BEBD6|nr:response regulator transcription factor [Streptomyces sp. JHA26]